MKHLSRMMKRLNRFMMGAVCLCVPQLSNADNWQVDRTKYYDFDGDKQLEWDKETSVYKFNSSEGNIVAVATKPHKYASWVNLDNDELIDWEYGYIDGHHSFYRGVDSYYSWNEFAVNSEGDRLPFDYNNDGHPDWVDSKSRKDAFTGYSGGSIKNASVRILTPEEYAGEAEWRTSGVVVQQWGDALSGDFFVGSSSVSITLPEYCIDMNGDGISDYIDCQTGTYIQNRLNGNGIIYSLGKAQIEDLNNDGLMDLISCSSESVIVHFMQKDGSVETKTVYSGATLNKPVQCYDFDKDGDVDILLPYGYISSAGGSYLVLLENQGAGKFNSQEAFFNKNMSFVECVDFDADGYLEVIGYENSGEYPVCFVRIKDGKIGEEVEYISGLSASQDAPLLVADIENEGYVSLIMDGNITRLSTTANERPSRPQKPTMTYEPSSGILKINWVSATDKESSFADLTYALRIGTAPDKCDVLYVHAHPDGTRKNLMGGNQMKSLFRTLNTDSWPEGTYYISVQAVDPNNRGSEFSEYTIFEKKQPACDFDLLYTYPLSTGEVCQVYPCSAVSDNSYKLDLNISGGRIVNSSQGYNGWYEIVFDETGDREISLVVTNNQGKKSHTITKTVNVQRSLFKDWGGETQLSLDMNEDGRMELFAFSKFYTMADDGYAEQITKLYNSNSNLTYISTTNSYTVDVNNDGMADVFSFYPYYYGQGHFSVVNQGNLNMTVGEYVSADLNDEYTTMLVDLDNNGELDLLWRKTMSMDFDNNFWYGQKNVGGYTSFEAVTLSLPQAKYSYLEEEDFQDFTGDGLVDVRKKVYAGYAVIYENQGDFTFLPVDTVDYDPEDDFILTEDFDNDGLADRMYETESVYSIVWGDGTTTLLTGVTPKVNNGVFDYNNDGCEDIAAYGGTGNEEGVLLLFGDHSFEFVNLGHSVGSVPTMFSVDNKIAISQYILTAQNTRPTAPSNISAGRNSKGVLLSWVPGTDQETPQCRLKYNLSVKRKGATGEGAYIISPCNSTKNGVHVPTRKPLVEGNTFLLPTSVIPAGEYEVQVQTVDGLWMESEFSVVFNLTVDATAWIESPAATGVNLETTIVIADPTAAEIDWDGGKVTGQTGNRYTVVWEYSGSKTIKVGNSQQTIYVHPLPNAEFEIPSNVIAKAKVKASVNNAKTGKWSVSTNGEDFATVEDGKLIQVTTIDSENAIIEFNCAGTYILRHTVVGEYGEGICERQIVVTGENIYPELQSVTALYGHYKLSWTIPSTNLSEDITAINIYKETNRANEYRLLSQVTLGDGEYTDSTSCPDIQSARYALSYVTTYGESAMTTPHQGMHVMINKGVGTSWNLTWTKYEGRDVQTYRILRGTSAEELELIGEVSGNMNSYSDPNPPTGILYYTVEIIHSEMAERISRAIDDVSVSRSNVVSTDMAGTVAFVESIELKGGKITANENHYLDIMAHIYPYYATYQAVNWVVADGHELATIDRYGRLTATGKGDGEVVVRAYALDGSGVYAETTVMLDGFVAANIDVPYQKEDVSINILQSGSLVEVSAPVGTQVMIYDLSGRQVLISTQANEVSYYRIEEKGFYVLRIGGSSYKFVCR